MAPVEKLLEGVPMGRPIPRLLIAALTGLSDPGDSV